MSTIDRLVQLGLRPIGGRYSPLSKDQISELEEHIGHSLPMNYRKFLQKYGRCRLSTDITIGSVAGSGLTFTQFFGAPEDGRTDDLFWYLDSVDDLPGSHLIFGDDLLGNPYILNSMSGGVYCKDDHAGGPDIAVADSFEDFVLRLTLKGDG